MVEVKVVFDGDVDFNVVVLADNKGLSVLVLGLVVADVVRAAVEVADASLLADNAGRGFVVAVVEEADLLAALLIVVL